MENVRVTKEMFERALSEVKPQYGVDEMDFAGLKNSGPFLEYNERLVQQMATISSLIDQVRTSSRTPLVSCLIQGVPKSGKTRVASKLAFASGFPFVRVISPDDLVLIGSESARCAKIVQCMEDAYKSPMAVVILDNIERILDYVPIGPRFSNAILQALLVLVKKPPPKEGKKLFVIGTTSQPAVLREVGLFEAFNESFKIPLVTGPRDFSDVFKGLLEPSDARKIVRHRFGYDVEPDAEVDSDSVNRIADDLFAAHISRMSSIPMGNYIMELEMARQYDDIVVDGGLVARLGKAGLENANVSVFSN